MRAKRHSRRAFTAAIFAVVVSAAGSALAQTDVRMIRPNVMVLLDTSGSMEWRTNINNATCTGFDGGACNLCSNGASMCSLSCPVAERHNRWTPEGEVLAGT